MKAAWRKTENTRRRISVKSLVLIAFAPMAFLAACLSAPSPSDPAVPPRSDGRKPRDVIAVMNTEAGESIQSIDAGSLLAKYSPLPEGFENPLVVSTVKEYYYQGKALSSRFELVYSGIAAVSGDQEVQTNEILGSSTGSQVSLCARSASLDPYLVACSNLKPVLENGFWYYNPGMYIPTEMKWLSYEPVSLEDFRSMWDHATDEENSLSLTMFTWWSLYKTALDSYPEAVAGPDGETYEQVVLYEGMPMRLMYQRGFLKYLEDEYVLGDPIYLYLQISGIDGSDREFKCHVRDFSLEPPEKIVETRLNSIMEK